MVRRRGRRAWPLLVVAALVVTAACGGSDDGEADGEDGDDAATTTTAGSTDSGGGDGDDGAYPGEEWERADAEEMGFDSEVLETIAADAEAMASECLVVVRQGRLVGEWYWGEGAPDHAREVFSVTKSFTSALAGIAQDDGDLSLEDPAADYIEEWQGTESDTVTVRNLLSNDSGREWSLELDYGQLPYASDRTQFAIDLGQQYEPGTAWSYNNAAIQTLDRVISEATGQTTAELAEERLFGPLGMDDTDMTGTAEDTATNTFFGLQSTCEDLARFGHLYLRDGAWDGEQIVSADYVEDSVGAPSQDLNAAYGLLWWLNVEGRLLDPLQGVSPSGGPQEEVVGQMIPGAPEDIFTAQGLGGQVILVDPGSETVVVRLGEGGGDGPLGGYRAPEAARVVTEALVDA